MALSNQKNKPDDVDRVRELFSFLQGTVPPGYHVQDERVPQLTADQAWAVVWYVQELHWQVPDSIERCDLCGELFDSDAEGGYTDDGPQHDFCCGACDHLRPVENGEETQ